MANPLKARPIADELFSKFQELGFSQVAAYALRDTVVRSDKTLTDKGEVHNLAPIKGRTEGLGTTAQNLTPTGQVNALSNVLDDAVYLKSPQFAGALNMAENGNFEASATLPPPGWKAVGNTVLSYDSATPIEGLRSLVITTTTQFGGAQALRKYVARPGDTFKVAATLRQANLAQAGTIVLVFLDKNGAQLGTVDSGAAGGGSGSPTPVFATGVAPANTSSAVLKAQSEAVNGGVFAIDSIVCTRLATAFELTPINTAGTPQSVTGLCTQSGAGLTTINVASSVWQFGDGTVSYNSGSVNPGSLGTWYVYADDPGYGGGSVTYVATATPSVCNAANGRVFFGKITTAAGTATSTGGGSGGGGPVSKALLA